MDSASIAAISILPVTTIREALLRLDKTGKRILFVVSGDNALIGVVTDGDIRRSIVAGTQLADPVSRVMNANYTALHQATPMIREQCRKIMIETTIEHIPVLDDNKRIVDIIRWTDAFGDAYRAAGAAALPNAVVIMAGGKGTRLDPFTRIFPKPLIPVGNKPVIEVIMEKFHASGFHRFIYTLNYRKEYVIAFLRENTFPYSCEWVEEREYLGTAGSLRLLSDRIDNAFFVTNCDTILDIDFAEALAFHTKQQAALTIIGCYNEIKIPFGVLETSEGKLVRMEEKPVHSCIVNTGAYIMDPRVIPYLPPQGPFDMNQLIDVVAVREKVCVHTIFSGWYDIGQLEQYRLVIDKLSAASY